MTITFNYSNGEIVSSPTVIVSGKTSTNVNGGIVSFTNNANKVFPPQHFEINAQGNFKALLHVSPNEVNNFSVEVAENGKVSPLGYAEYDGSEPKIIDKGTLSLTFNPLPQNKPVHLCLIVGKDSPGTYDMPKYRLDRGERNDLDSAIKKLKVGGRLMQAFTQEEFRNVGLSNRSFQFVEETVDSQRIFGYDVISPTAHQEVKVHVLRSPKTVVELRDPNIAQQNPNAKDNGGLFSHALELIKNTPELFDKVNGLGTSIQCACIYLDSTWDRGNKLILTHAALGGGHQDIKLAIFGSHGLHSWPVNFPRVAPSFLDVTKLSINEVANDCNQCGTSWECLNITLGAFMHEIGHLFGSPHQVNGVMLRDYIWFNRSFMTRELQCLRTGSGGATVDLQGKWPTVCHWNLLDLIRYLYHDSFSLPIDSFDKLFATTQLPNSSYPLNNVPVSYNVPNGGAVIKSDAGIYLVEYVTKDLAYNHQVWYPQSYGGDGLQREIKLDFQTSYEFLKQKKRDAEANFSVRILSLAGDLYIDNFKAHCDSSHKDDLIEGDFGLNRGTIRGYKTSLLGRKNNNGQQVIGFDIKTIYKVRVYHGNALDGVKFFYKSESGATSNAPPVVPPRNYLSKILNKATSNADVSGEERSSLLGKERPHYTDFLLQPNEQITKFNFRNGAWVDAIQFETTTGRKSPMYGKADGGHLSSLEVPSSEFTIVGMYGFVGGWLDGIGLIYSHDL
ncbi:zinc metallo proteinase [Scheffersomyces coipomensis]|uniref:zinc metallo proteinase n=1 Tax=Scheffersomyces coipomensis TaxID=1788519 RepID=UPI00315D5BE5